MVKASPAITAFNVGELSPLLAMAHDFNKYRNGLKRCRNFLPTVQGPIYRRGGFRHVAEVKNSAQKTWVVRFEYNVNIVYVLEFGDQYIRFYTSGARVVESAVTITGVTAANPAVITAAGHGYSNDQDVEISGIVGTMGNLLNGRTVRVKNATANTFEVHDYGRGAIDSTGYAYTSGGEAARVYEIAAPWTSADLTNSDGTFALDMVQSLDTVYICRSGYKPRKLVRTTSTSWALSELDTKNGPFKSIDPDTTTTVYASGETGSVTLQASADIFLSTHVGSLFLLEQRLTDAVKAWEVGKTIVINDIRRSQGHYYKALTAGTTGTITPSHTEGARYDGDAGVQWEYLHSGYGWAEITAFTDANTVTATVISRIPSMAVGSGNASTKWAFGAWSDAEGWPTRVMFFRERLALAKGTNIRMSVPRDYENFAERDAGVVTTDSAISIDIVSDVSNDIQWMIPSEDLIVGTSGGTFAVGEISTADALGPANIASVDGVGYGARAIRPIKANGFILYVQRSGRVLREIRFDAGSSGYVALNRTVLAEHIAKGRITSLTYASEPDSVAWATCANGDLLSFTFDPEHDVQAWGVHPLGGSGNAECVVSVPASNGDHDQIWGIFERTIDGGTRRYVEVSSEKWDEDVHALADATFIDSYLTATGSGLTSIGNLWHLEGQEVRILKNGAGHPARTVANGSIALNSATGADAKVHVGLGFASIAETMSLEAGAMEGTAQGKKKRISRIIFRLYQTVRGFLFGPDDEHLDALGGVSGSQEMNAPPPVVTGDTDSQGYPGGHETAASIVITRDDAFPCTLVGIMPEMHSEG